MADESVASGSMDAIDDEQDASATLAPAEPGIPHASAASDSDAHSTAAAVHIPPVTDEIPKASREPSKGSTDLAAFESLKLAGRLMITALFTALVFTLVPTPLHSRTFDLLNVIQALPVWLVACYGVGKVFWMTARVINRVPDDVPTYRTVKPLAPYMVSSAAVLIICHWANGVAFLVPAALFTGPIVSAMVFFTLPAATRASLNVTLIHFLLTAAICAVGAMPFIFSFIFVVVFQLAGDSTLLQLISIATLHLSMFLHRKVILPRLSFRNTPALHNRFWFFGTIYISMVTTMVFPVASSELVIFGILAMEAMHVVALVVVNEIQSRHERATGTRLPHKWGLVPKVWESRMTLPSATPTRRSASDPRRVEVAVAKQQQGGATAIVPDDNNQSAGDSRPAGPKWSAVRATSKSLRTLHSPDSLSQAERFRATVFGLKVMIQFNCSLVVMVFITLARFGPNCDNFVTWSPTALSSEVYLRTLMRIGGSLLVSALLFLALRWYVLHRSIMAVDLLKVVERYTTGINSLCPEATQAAVTMAGFMVFSSAGLTLLLQYATGPETWAELMVYS